MKRECICQERKKEKKKEQKMRDILLISFINFKLIYYASSLMVTFFRVFCISLDVISLVIYNFNRRFYNLCLIGLCKTKIIHKVSLGRIIENSA